MNYILADDLTNDWFDPSFISTQSAILKIPDSYVLYSVYAKAIINNFPEIKCNASLTLDIGVGDLTSKPYQYYAFEVRNNETAEVLFSIVDQPSIEKINECLLEILINLKKLSNDVEKR